MEPEIECIPDLVRVAALDGGPGVRDGRGCFGPVIGGRRVGSQRASEPSLTVVGDLGQTPLSRNEPSEMIKRTTCTKKPARGDTLENHYTSRGTSGRE